MIYISFETTDSNRHRGNLRQTGDRNNTELGASAYVTYAGLTAYF